MAEWVKVTLGAEVLYRLNSGYQRHLKKKPKRHRKQWGISTKCTLTPGELCQGDKSEVKTNPEMTETDGYIYGAMSAKSSRNNQWCNPHSESTGSSLQTPQNVVCFGCSWYFLDLKSQTPCLSSQHIKSRVAVLLLPCDYWINTENNKQTPKMKYPLYSSFTIQGQKLQDNSGIMDSVRMRIKLKFMKMRTFQNLTIRGVKQVRIVWIRKAKGLNKNLQDRNSLLLWNDASFRWTDSHRVNKDLWAVRSRLFTKDNIHKISTSCIQTYFGVQNTCSGIKKRQ